ncbi:RbsK Sugar kinases, ribokinase family [Rhabdaerophilaceae bacterium]
MHRILTVGIAVLDDIFRIPMPLIPGQKHRAAGLSTTIGGTATNGGFAIARLGGRPSLLTRFGDDAAARQLREMLEGYGIETAMSPGIPGCATSRSTIVIEPDGERTIINILDSSLPDYPDWLPDRLPEGFDAVLGDVRWEFAAKRLFKLARAAGKFAVLDGDRAPTDPDLIDSATHVAFSAQGLRELAGIGFLPDGLAKVAHGRSHFIAVTDGINGVYSHFEGRITHHKAFEVVQVDTLGAGDVWHGAFTFALCDGLAINQAIRFASAAAAIKVTRRGGVMGAPSKPEILAFLEERS